ncbi:hypothetical protein B0H13DRAFT_1878098 [Mycena leptocephala]|nr:hypothetical protein B0H13DRAFT_1878098 [Mycena leptocephala]
MTLESYRVFFRRLETFSGRRNNTKAVSTRSWHIWKQAAAKFATPRCSYPLRHLSFGLQGLSNLFKCSVASPPSLSYRRQCGGATICALPTFRAPRYELRLRTVAREVAWLKGQTQYISNSHRLEKPRIRKAAAFRLRGIYHSICLTCADEPLLALALRSLDRGVENGDEHECLELHSGTTPQCLSGHVMFRFNFRLFVSTPDFVTWFSLPTEIQRNVRSTLRLVSAAVTFSHGVMRNNPVSSDQRHWSRERG